ncbi:uncharacterized protein BDV17DRAFT_296343 [Aspergillus undulatus]|uniref:uncharacterized protein n=1 Tax=Aspergillus undulatus TaxID=1810928 RepID=UPI003CCCF48C
MTTHLSPEYPDTWERMFQPYHAAGGLCVTQDSIEGSPLFDEHPETRAEEEPEGGGIEHRIAMMHQLHCLFTLRGVLYPENNNLAVNSTSRPPDVFTDDEVGRMGRMHLSHCFEYLIQTIIYAADDTLETPHKEINDDGIADWYVTPGGKIHQCKDPQPLWEMSVRAHMEPMNMSDWRPGVGGAGILF